MDSYSYRDGPGRSPPERGWNGRDDRMKDERPDSFYRGRSPGAFSLDLRIFVRIAPPHPHLLWE